MKLYYSPGACSLAPIILAEWLELPLEIERVNLKEPSEAFLAANPLGAVPTLELNDGTAMTQVDAILHYFLDLKPGSGLGPGEDIMDRFHFHRWQALLTGDYHPPFGAWFNPRRYTTDHSEESLKAVKAAVEQRIRKVANQLEGQIGEGTHIALGRRTMLDGYAYAMLRWLRMFEKDLGPWPNIARFLETVEQDDGVQRALGREKGST